MLEFFIGLFGSIYYGARLGSERRRKKAADARWEAMLAEKDAFRKKYEATLELEEELGNWVRNPKNFDEICWMLHDELVAVYGEEYREKLHIRTDRAAGEPFLSLYSFSVEDIDDGDWITHLLLAKMGMIGSNFWFEGYALGPKNTSEHAKRIEYCRQIEKNLIEHGVEDGYLYLLPGIGYTSVNGVLKREPRFHEHYGHLTFKPYAYGEQLKRLW